MLTAKPVLKDKFWILEEFGEKVGTVSINDDKFIVSNSEGVRFYNSKKQLEKSIGKTVFTKTELKNVEPEKSVHGFPTSTAPFNAMYDVKRKLPLFTKSLKSKSLYCAGYYVIRFEKGWVKSHCPKLITIERYESKGPFKTDIEMKAELSRVNK
jgi:hypothetical protein